MATRCIHALGTAFVYRFASFVSVHDFVPSSTSLDFSVYRKPITLITIYIYILQCISLISHESMCIIVSN